MKLKKGDKVIVTRNQGENYIKKGYRGFITETNCRRDEEGFKQHRVQYTHFVVKGKLVRVENLGHDSFNYHYYTRVERLSSLSWKERIKNAV